MQLIFGARSENRVVPGAREIAVLETAEPAKDIEAEYIRSIQLPDFKAQEEALAKEVQAHEEKRIRESRLDMVRELNDGRDPEVTPEEKELLAKWMRENGLRSVYED